jgi:hypothetical protein
MAIGVYYMETWQIIIITLFGAGFGYHMYKIGIKEGAEICLIKLTEQKIISLDNKGNIKPNPFWEEFQKTKNKNV